VKQKGRRPVDPFAIYFPFEGTLAPETFLILKSSLPSAALTAAAAKAVQSVDPAQPVFDVATMEERLAESLAAQRANMTLMGVFAALALILATVGIFGVIAYFVNSRVQEIAIRMALGASGRAVVHMVLRHGMTLAAAGIAAGVAGALILTRTLGSLIEGVGTNDALSFLGASLLFGFVAAMACSIPARRAARVDPMAALRHG
jgi:ABC-type antimicrobial peptide transport system permease subunit